jgi:DNA-binding beta-propeller fold protein YncE
MNRPPKALFLGLVALIALAYFFFANGLAYADLLYVANNANNTVDVIDPNGQASVFASTGLSGPFGLAFDSSGNLYVGNFNNNTVEKFNSGGQGTVFANSLMDGPAGMAFDTNGNLYVASLNEPQLPFVGSIAKFDSTGHGTVFTDSTRFNSGLHNPYGLAIDNNGFLYSANVEGDNIVKYDRFGTATIFATSSLNHPTGIAFDKNGNLYVSNFGDQFDGFGPPNGGTIVKFDSQGNGTLFASGLNGPIGLAFDSVGTLYGAMALDNTIEKFDSSGNGTVFASGLDTPLLIAFQVPEPATWILVVLGGGVVFASRYKRFGI